MNGLLQNNAAIIGPGPFDSGRRIDAGVPTIAGLSLLQRGPSSGTTTVEFYRIRGAYPGTVTSLGTVSLNNTQQFQYGTAVPVVSSLVEGDIVFVSFAVVPGAGALDLTAFIEFS